MNLQNKTIVVTGVASGIGAEVARLARFHGAKVIGVDRTPVQMTLHGFHQADLGDPASIDALVKALPDHMPWRTLPACRAPRRWMWWRG